MDNETRYNLEKKFRDELDAQYDEDAKFKQGFEFALKLFIAMEDMREKQSEEIMHMINREASKVFNCSENERIFLNEIRKYGTYKPLQFFGDEIMIHSGKIEFPKDAHDYPTNAVLRQRHFKAILKDLVNQ